MKTHALTLQIKKTISTEKLIGSSDKVLVGVSGGVDSVVLCTVLKTLGYETSIAHYNFLLRGEESNQDAFFVKALAQKLDIPFHITQENTKLFAQTHSISIEMAARDLRYNWFAELCADFGYTKIAIAHNANDSVETFFINLFRSSGIKGLRGIQIQNGNVIRPLITITRNEIETFAHEFNLEYRTDSSNLENEYLRNKIRNILIPVCNEIQTSSFEAIQNTIGYISESYDFYKKTIDKEISIICSVHNNTLIIEKDALIEHSHSKVLLFEILHSYNFNSDVIQQLHKNIANQVGKRYESSTHTAILDRDFIFVEANSILPKVHIEISQQNETIQIPEIHASLTCKIFGNDNFEIDLNRKVANIDIAKITFPLTIRNWQEGDSFKPFGMKGSKKVSDYLVDKKVPVHKKQSILVIESAGEIIWIVGQRISQPVAVNENTKQILQITYIED